MALQYEEPELFKGNAMVRSSDAQEIFNRKAQEVTDISFTIQTTASPLRLHRSFDGHYRLLGELSATQFINTDNIIMDLSALISEDIFPISGFGVYAVDISVSPNVAKVVFMRLGTDKIIELIDNIGIPDNDVLHFDIKIQLNLGL